VAASLPVRDRGSPPQSPHAGTATQAALPAWQCSHCSEREEHIDAFIEAYNQNATPFAWTKAEVHQRRVKDRRISEL
jgi:hypothetical protein